MNNDVGPKRYYDFYNELGTLKAWASLCKVSSVCVIHNPDLLGAITSHVRNNKIS